MHKPIENCIFFGRHNNVPTLFQQFTSTLFDDDCLLDAVLLHLKVYNFPVLIFFI